MRISLGGRRGVVVALTAAAGLVAGGLMWRVHEAGVRTADRAARASAIESALLGRDPVRAEVLVDSWALAEPRGTEPDYWRARVALAAGRPDVAMEAMRRAGEAGYPLESFRGSRGVILAMSGDEARAEPILRTALDADRFDPEVANAYTNIVLKGLRFAEAREAIARWIAAAPADPRPHLARAEIDARTDAPVDVAIRDYREALAREPGLESAALALAHQLVRARRMEEAIALLGPHLDRHPDDLAARLDLGRAEAGLGRVGPATEAFDRVLAALPNDHEAQVERASIDLVRGRYEEAARLLERAIASDPFDPDAHHQMAMSLVRLGQIDRSRVEQEAATRLQAEHAEMGQIRQMLGTDPTNPGLWARAAGWLLAHRRDEEGLRWAEALLARDPNDAAMNRLLATYYRDRGDFARANYHAARAGP